MTRTTDSTTTSNTEWKLINPDLVPMTGWELLADDVGGRHSFLIEYYKECRRGNIIIGRELKTTLEGLIQDIFYHSEEIRFDLQEAHKRIDFIEKEIKLFESPFAGKPFILALCQKAIAEAVFGFYIYDPNTLDGGRWVRKYTEILLLVARKNGKTPFVAALLLAEWFCGEMGQRAICASNDYDQADIIFDTINSFREESVKIARVTRKNQKGIFFGNPKQRKKHGKFTKQNKGTIKKISKRQKNKEGRNAKLVAVDEVHEMEDSSLVLPLQTSVSTQDEPLYFEITTEGIVRDGYLDARLELARKVLKGQESKPRWLIWLYTQDSEAEVWNDPTSWGKSNPMLGICKKHSYIEEKVEDAKRSNADRAYILAKDFNIKQLSARAWLEESQLAYKATFNLDDFRNTWAIVGVDLAETNDLCACTFLLMKPNDPTKYMHTMYFVTEAKANDPTSTESPTNPEKKDYKQWEREGFVRIVKGNVIDDDVVAKYIREIYNTYGIRPFKVGYDQWHAKEFAKLITQYFDPTSNILLKINMSCEVLNVPTRTVEADLRAQHINYNNNEVCKWCFRNAAIRRDKHGFVMPEKISGYIGNKIDGTMSKVIAYATLRECKSAFMAKIGA